VRPEGSKETAEETYAEAERRYAAPFVVGGMVLFCGGIAFALYTMPQALRFLIGPIITGDQLEPMLTGREYIGFAMRYLLAFGLAFQLPVVLMILALARVVTSGQMAKYRRHVLVGFTALAAFLTPPDAYTLVLGAGVLYAMYEASIWLARLFRR
jgi:sec-independent protein translocase protein TatC